MKGPGNGKFHVLLTANNAQYVKWQSRIMYHYYKKAGGRTRRPAPFFHFFLKRSWSPKALHMVSLTNPLRSFKVICESLRLWYLSVGVWAAGAHTGPLCAAALVSGEGGEPAERVRAGGGLRTSI